MMSDLNQYQTPQSQVDQAAPQGFSKPKIMSVSGRIGRMRFLAYSIGAYLIFAFLMQLLSMRFTLAISPSEVGGQVVLGGVKTVFFIIWFALSFMFAIQRSHDMNTSGWLSLILLIPVLGFLVFLFAPGTHGGNRYDASPPPNGVGVILLALIMPIIGFIGILAAIAIPAYNGYIQSANEAQQMEQPTEQR